MSYGSGGRPHFNLCSCSASSSSLIFLRPERNLGPPDTIGARYAARVGTRPAGHPGLDYVPELIALAGRAKPTDRGPRHDVNTTLPLDSAALAAWVTTHLR